MDPEPGGAGLAHRTAQDDRVVGSGRASLLALALALLSCVALLAAELYLLDGRLGLPLDDGWIHLQFARNLAAGSGLTYNPGERVTGSTSPLWTALLSIGFLVRLSPLWWAKALGIAAHLAGVAGAWRLAVELGVSRGLATLAGCLMATTSALVWGALSGMEIPLFVALSLWGVVLHVRERRDPRRPPLSFAVLGVACLARPEGLLLLVCAVIDRFLVFGGARGGPRRPMIDWRSLLAGVVLAALALVPVLAVYQWLGGSPLPTTFGTKAGYSTPGLPRARYLLEVVFVLARAQPVATLLAPFGALALIARLGGPRDRGLLPALWTGSLPLAYSVLSGGGHGIFGNFGRYFFPLLPFVIVLAVLGVSVALEDLLPRVSLSRASSRTARRSWTPWVALVFLVPGLAALAKGASSYVRNIADIENGDVRLARILADSLPPEATIGVDDIGALKYLLPNRVLDLVGIVSPDVHAFAHRSFAATGSYCPGVLEFVREERPDYLAIFPRRDACFGDGEFPPLLRVDVPDNITLGEGTIVFRSTPWTRYPLRAPLAAVR